MQGHAAIVRSLLAPRVPEDRNKSCGRLPSGRPAGQEPGLSVRGKGSGDTCAHLVTDLVEAVVGIPADLGHLTVDGERLARDPAAPEGEIKVVALVAVGVRDPGDLMHPGQSVGPDDDTGLFGGLTDRGIGRFLTRIDDAGDRREGTVVAASPQQHVAPSDDDGGHADERKRSGADESAQLENEVRGGHAPTVSAHVDSASRPAAGRDERVGCRT